MKNHLTAAITTGALLVFGVMIAIYERNHLTATQHAEKYERFNALADRSVRQLVQRLQIYEYGLRGTRGAILTAGSEGITRDKFRAYSESRELAREFPGSRGFGFIRRVMPEAESKFLRSARADGQPAFQIRQLSPHAGERFVIQYIEPEASNREAIGLDIASESNRQKAALEAIRSNKPVLTHPITLVQASGNTLQGLLFMLPIYRPKMPLDSPEQRLLASYGLAYTPLLVDEVLADFDFVKGELSLALDDFGGTSAPFRFYASAGVDAAVIEGLIKHVVVSVYGRDWQLEIKARQSFIDSLNHQNPDKVALEIVLASVLLAAMVFLLLHNIQRRRQSALDHAKLAAIVESSTDAIIGKDLNGLVTSWNRAAETIFGYSAEEAIGQRLANLVIPAEFLQEEAEILDRIHHGKSVPHRITVRHRKDKRLIDVSITVSPIRAGDGRVVGASKTVRDVTEEIRKERRFRLAIDAAHVGVWVWDLQSNSLGWDERMFELYGAPESLRETGLYYDYWKAHVHPDDLVEAEKKLLMHVAGEGVFDAIFRVVRDDGSVVWIQASATVECDHTGKPLQMVGTNLDITEQVLARTRILELNADLENQVAQRTVELREAVAVAQRANEAKSEFLSNMSHEIRTPMNAILNLAYLLQRQELSGDSRGMIEKIHGAGRVLLSIINDILDFSKIEAKRLEIEDVPFRLCDVLDNLANIMSSAVGDKPVETVIAPPPVGADFLRGDGLRLGQVLINLISNAIKFTEHGEVVLSIARLDCVAADQIKLRFAVRDTGIGIPKDKQASIFQAFSQADSSTTRSYGGTGLGLTISSRLVELMGGRLEVSSEPGQGSEFSFEIAFGLSDPSSSAVPEMLHQRVMVVDDQPSARAALAQTVSSLGWNADVVVSGELAIERARSIEQPHDILLLDWRMPRIDGLQAALKIREFWGHKKASIIIMVSAADREQLQNQPGSEIADVVLTKPVTSSSLYNAVQLAKKHRGELGVQTTVTPADVQRLSGVRVLVVDDSEINREVAACILSGEGAIVDLAEDGSVAVNVLMSRREDFDIVLMDMQMPVMDGYEATRQIRSTPRHATIPVIALTAGAFATQRNLAIEAGVNAFVAKPFEVDVLIDAIQRLIAPSPKTPLSSMDTLPTFTRGSIPGDASTIPIINMNSALRIWKEPAAFRQYLQKFAKSYLEAVASMWAGTPEQAIALAHKLRGAAAQLGLDQLANLAEKAERILNSGQDASGVLLQLQTSMQETLAAINEFAPTDSDTKISEVIVQHDHSRLSPELSRLMEALHSDDIKLVEPIIDDLKSNLPEEQLASLREAVSSYDFRGAEAVVCEVANQLKINLRR